MIISVQSVGPTYAANVGSTMRLWKSGGSLVGKYQCSALYKIRALSEVQNSLVIRKADFFNTKILLPHLRISESRKMVPKRCHLWILGMKNRA